MGAIKRRNVRTSIVGCRVWVSPRLVKDRSFSEYWTAIRASKKTWRPATWAARVRTELRLKWGGCKHGGVRRMSVGTPASACKTELRACAWSASGDLVEDCSQRTDVSMTGSATGRVEPRSPNVSCVSRTGLAIMHISEARSGAEQPAALGNVDSDMSPNGLGICAPTLAKTKACQMMEKLGEGSYGQVYRCIWRGRSMAVKIKKHEGDRDNEITLLKVLGAEGGHPSIVPLVFWRRRQATGDVCLYFPMFSLDLKDCLRKHASAKAPLGVRAVLQMASTLCAATSFMHARCVMHRDLKPRNILMRREEIQPAANRAQVLDGYFSQWCPVICDFGNACHLAAQSRQLPSRRYCTLQYCAPEVLMPFVRYAWPSDVWSLGLVLAEVEHLSPVALSSSPARSNIAQLLILWKLCQPAAAQQPLGAFAAKVKLQLACYPEVDISTTLANTSPHPTLGRVYGAWFADLVGRFLKMDPSERSTVGDLHDRCVQRVGLQNLALTNGAGQPHSLGISAARGACPVGRSSIP